ncbi:hypothetical protein ACIO13_23795 [Streptomyces sp. NPDC087425]|uniref:hypothetical protein n=1 Tax=Streptomyces sp. NPDC087425 TaxID=3365787 RepID=UPI00380F73A9
MAALDRRLSVIAASTDLAGGAAAFRELNAELRLIDPGAFEGRENWWPRVLDNHQRRRPNGPADSGPWS